MNNSIRTNSVEISASAGLVAGLVLGGLVGFGTMMLFTPQSGKKARDQIGQRSAELQTRAVDTFDDIVVLSHFDNRKILAGTRTDIQNR